MKQIDSLSKGEIITGVYNILNIQEKLSEDVSGYFWNMSDDFPRHHLPNVEKALEQGLKIRVIFPKNLFPSLKLSGKNMEKIQFRGLDEVRLSVMTKNRFSILKLPGPDGNIDQNTAIFGYDERFQEWCEKLFNHYWEDKRGMI
jgi:predicted transcriptional regulator